MTLAHLTTILPGHGIEDFPFYLSGDEVREVLAGWTAAWHPALMVAVGKAPAWAPAIYPPDVGEPGLIFLPEPARRELTPDWIDEARAAGSLVIETSAPRSSLVAKAVSALGAPAAGIAEAVVPDFFALGFSYLQVELLTRAMRYSSHLDEEFFRGEAYAAAVAAAQEDGEEAQRLLAVCFDALADARNHFYPVDAYLIDLVLTAPTTLGSELRDELADDVPSNVLLSGRDLELLAETEPATLTSLRQRLDQQTLGIAGGEYSALEVGIVARETLLADLSRGRTSYSEHLGTAPQVFARSTWGLAPSLPDLLVPLGFVGAVHLAFDGQTVPTVGQAKLGWKGLGPVTIPALCAAPRDAADPQAMLQLAQRLGGTMDDDHVATLVFAHWPGQVCPWYEDLRRACRYGPALGKFVTLEEYFTNTQLPEGAWPIVADDYRSPQLVEDFRRQTPDPLSRHVRRQAAETAENASAVLHTMAALTDPACGSQAELPTVDLTAATGRLVRSITAGAAGTKATGPLLVNPTATPRRTLIRLPRRPAAAQHIRLVDESNRGCDAVVDVPPYGYAWVGGQGPSEPRPSSDPAVASETLLRNEHFQVELDSSSGGIRGLRSYRHRDRLLTTQLVVCRGSDGRWPQAKDRSRMLLDSTEVQESAGLLGVVEMRGRIVDEEDRLLAEFQQVLQLMRGSRLLQMEFQLTPHLDWEAAGGGPWQNYLGLRLNWEDPTAKLFHSVDGCCVPSRARRFVAGEYLEIRHSVARLTLLTGGLPFHRRRGDRAVDTPLVISGETAERFTLGIGWDLPAPWSAAEQLLLPDDRLTAVTPPPPLPAAWLAHLHPSTVRATRWGLTPRGFVARLLETVGRRGECRLQTARPVGRAWTTDFQGERGPDLLVEEGTIIMEYQPYQWVQVEAEWAATPPPRGA